MKASASASLQTMIWLLILPIVGAVAGLLRPGELPFDALRVEAVPFEVLQVHPEGDAVESEDFSPQNPGEL